MRLRGVKTMPGDGSELARTIVQAYRASGIAAKVHGGKLFIEREEGWEGPIEPVSTTAVLLMGLAAVALVAASTGIFARRDLAR